MDDLGWFNNKQAKWEAEQMTGKEYADKKLEAAEKMASRQKDIGATSEYNLMTQNAFVIGCLYAELVRLYDETQGVGSE